VIIYSAAKVLVGCSDGLRSQDRTDCHVQYDLCVQNSLYGKCTDFISHDERINCKFMTGAHSAAFLGRIPNTKWQKIQSGMGIIYQQGIMIQMGTGEKSITFPI